MTDKHRHHRPHAPRGALSNWVLGTFMVGATVVVVIARAIG
jgi:hypothetical protein